MLNCYLYLSISLGCKGICIRYDKIGGGKESAYHRGYKRCTSVVYTFGLMGLAVLVVTIH